MMMSLTHRLTRMTGRDPHEPHRAATPLELLFDLTFVAAFSQISAQTAHLLELGHVASAITGFAFTAFAVTWAWINYTWLASAYDTDDIFFRLATFVEMIGVVIVVLGVPPLFESIDEGAYIDNGVMVAGYVVMRVAAIALWLRAAAHDRERRATCLAYAINISIAQVGWVALIFLNLPLIPTLTLTIVLTLFELAGPVFAERRFTATPWHPHHIAERYGLLVIITLGEIILGTVLAISAVVQSQGWALESGLVVLGGTALAFTMWWVYFVIPTGTFLERRRERSFGWGYLHMIVFAALVGVGAGLHVAAQVIAHEAHVDAVFAAWTIAVPLLVFEAMVFVLYTLLTRSLDPLHVWLLAGSIALVLAAVGAVAAGASIGTGLLVFAASPLIVIVGYETVGHRHLEALIARRASAE